MELERVGAFSEGTGQVPPRASGSGATSCVSSFDPWYCSTGANCVAVRSTFIEEESHNR